MTRDMETPSLSLGVLLPDGSQGPALPHPTPSLVPLPSILRTLCSQTRNPLDSIQQSDFGPCVQLPSLTVHRPSWPSP